MKRYFCDIFEQQHQKLILHPVAVFHKLLEPEASDVMTSLTELSLHDTFLFLCSRFVAHFCDHMMTVLWETEWIWWAQWRRCTLLWWCMSVPVLILEVECCFMACRNILPTGAALMYTLDEMCMLSMRMFFNSLTYQANKLLEKVSSTSAHYCSCVYRGWCKIN